MRGQNGQRSQNKRKMEMHGVRETKIIVSQEGERS